jgi:hypothetical protein
MLIACLVFKININITLLIYAFIFTHTCSTFRPTQPSVRPPEYLKRVQIMKLFINSPASTCFFPRRSEYFLSSQLRNMLKFSDLHVTKFDNHTKRQAKLYLCMSNFNLYIKVISISLYVCVFSLMYPACNAHAPYYHL